MGGTGGRAGTSVGRVVIRAFYVNHTKTHAVLMRDRPDGAFDAEQAAASEAPASRCWIDAFAPVDESLCVGSDQTSTNRLCPCSPARCPTAATAKSIIAKEIAKRHVPKIEYDKCHVQKDILKGGPRPWYVLCPVTCVPPSLSTSAPDAVPLTPRASVKSLTPPTAPALDLAQLLW